MFNSLDASKKAFLKAYLGLPLSTSKLPISAYTPYIQKADRYLGCWQAQLLNTMGRAVLVNAVLDSQLVYFMSSLALPPSVIHQMDRRRRAFMWAGERTGTVPSEMPCSLDSGVQPQRSRRTWYQRYGRPKCVPPAETHSPASFSSTFCMGTVG